jgi:hypothetical protein
MRQDQQARGGSVKTILRMAWRALVPILVLAVVHRADAQQPIGVLGQPALPGVEILITPYLWLPWTSLDIRPSDSRLSSASETIDPGKLISHLTWVPFMGQAEFRSGAFGLITDYIHAPLKAGVGTRTILFNGAGAGLRLDTGSAVILYRTAALPDQYFDIGMGVRAWGVDGQISLNEGLVPSVTVSNGLSWADPLIGVRYHREFGNGFGATAYGDVGGFGVGAHIDWQLIGTIDYALWPGIDLHAGFRTLNFNFTATRAKFDMNMYGPTISATVHF